MTWTKTNPFESNNAAIYSICKFGSKIYAGTYYTGVGVNNYAQIWESTDGISWTKNATFPTSGDGITGPSTAGLDGDKITGMVVFGGKLIVLRVWAGQPRIYSYDGATWVVERKLYDVYSLTYSRSLMTNGSKLYVSGGSGGSRVLYSASSASGTWTSELTSTRLATGYISIAYGSDIFLGGDSNWIHRKTGGSWDTGTQFASSQYMYDACVFKNKLYFIANKTGDSTKTQLHCWDGATWTTTTLSATFTANPTIFVSADNYLQTNALDTAPGGVGTYNLYKSPDGVDFSITEVYGNSVGAVWALPRSHYNFNTRSLLGATGTGSAIGGVIYSGQLVTVDFTGVPVSGVDPTIVAFTNTSTGDVAWSWDFGDGNVSVLENPSNSYSGMGFYDVTLSAWGIAGDDNTKVTTTKLDYIEILNGMPEADFDGKPLVGRLPSIVSFTDESTNTPTSWLWNFGDPASGALNTSTLQNPIHTYTDANVYSVTLQVTNPSGTDTITKTGYISVTEEDPMVGNSRVLKITNNGQVQFFEASTNGVNRINLKAPASLANTIDLVLPSALPLTSSLMTISSAGVLGAIADGEAGFFVQTDGAGNYTWSATSASLQAAYTGGKTINAGPGPLAVSGSSINPLVTIARTSTGSGSALEVTGPIVHTGTHARTGNANITGNTTQTGTINLIGNSTQTGSETLNGNQNITGNTTQSGTINLTGNSTQTGTNTLVGASTQTGDVVLTGNSTITGNLTETGLINLTGTSTGTAAMTIAGNGPSIVINQTAAQMGLRINQSGANDGLYINKSSTSGAAISLNNSNAVTDVVSNNWSVTNAGAASFTALAVTNTQVQIYDFDWNAAANTQSTGALPWVPRMIIGIFVGRTSDETTQMHSISMGFATAAQIRGVTKLDHVNNNNVCSAWSNTQIVGVGQWGSSPPLTYTFQRGIVVSAFGQANISFTPSGNLTGKLSVLVIG